MDDHRLLRDYVNGQSETAFAELVNRHVGLVYSTALRIVRDPGLAEDVAQLVFIKLAKKAGSIRAETLSAWLYRVAYNQAVKSLQGEETRRNRETEAMNLTETDTDPALVWSEIASDLDAAMQTLSSAEQSAVVLRFFEGHNWREVSRALALSEDTAQRRVGSALEKLRAHFVRRGITVSASVLGLTIGANAVQAAPATLGTSLTSAALAAASAKGAGGLSALFKFLAAKWQMTAAVVTGVTVAGITTTAVVFHHFNPVNAGSLRPGLVLHLGFDQAEAAGRVGDDSGLGNHGQVTGARWTPGGRRGGAYEFRGDGDQIEVPNHPSLNPANITISAWIKTPAPDASIRCIMEKSTASGYSLAILGDGHEGNARGKVHVTTGANCISGGFVADGQWHLLTATYDGSTQRLFVDGRCEKTLDWPGLSLSNDHNLLIGRNANSDPKIQRGPSFRGLIDDVRVYNRALSSEEVSFLFASAER